MIIGETILGKIKSVYYGPRDYELLKYHLEGFYEEPSPRVWGDRLNLNYQDHPILGLDLKKKNNSVEVHVSNTIYYGGTCNSGIDKFDEKIVQMLCNKYKLIKVEIIKTTFIM